VSSLLQLWHILKSRTSATTACLQTTSTCPDHNGGSQCPHGSLLSWDKTGLDQSIFRAISTLVSIRNGEKVNLPIAHERRHEEEIPRLDQRAHRHARHSCSGLVCGARRRIRGRSLLWRHVTRDSSIKTREPSLTFLRNWRNTLALAKFTKRHVILRALSD
jgi:hypothetical protein